MVSTSRISTSKSSTSKSSTSEPIRALFVVPAFYRNGAVALCVSLAEQLGRRSDISVEVLATRRLKVQSRLPNDPIQSTIIRKRSKLARRLALFTQLVKSSFKADVVLLTSENGLALPTLAALILRKPTLAIVQNNLSRTKSDYPQSKGAQLFRHWAYSYAQAVVCTSQALTRLAETKTYRKKVTAISNGVDVERVRSLAKLNPQATGSLSFLSEDVPYIVGIGRLCKQKGFDILIRAHAAVRQRGYAHRLVLVGEGEGLANLTAIAQRLNVEDSVIFAGYLENPYPVLAKASLFCSSSRYEGFGLVIAEAAALGVPTIATDCVSGPSEILADGQYGELIAPDSVVTMSTAIEKHFEHPQRLRAKARTSAKDANRLSLETCAQAYSDLIKRCLAGTGVVTTSGLQSESHMAKLQESQSPVDTPVDTPVESLQEVGSRK